MMNKKPQVRAKCTIKLTMFSRVLKFRVLPHVFPCGFLRLIFCYMARYVNWHYH